MSVVPMPSSCGDSRITSRRCSLPSKTASRSAWSMSPDGRVVVQVLEGGDDHLAGDVAGRVAAHAVGDGEQPGPGVDRVLVVAADQAAVGAGRVAEDEGHASSSPAVGGRVRQGAVLNGELAGKLAHVRSSSAVWPMRIGWPGLTSSGPWTRCWSR